MVYPPCLPCNAPRTHAHTQEGIFRQMKIKWAYMLVTNDRSLFPFSFNYIRKWAFFLAEKGSRYHDNSTIYEIFYLVLLFWKVFIVSLKSVFGYHKTSKREIRTTVVLEWENKKLQLNFKEFSKGFDQATVRDLKEKCKLLTNVPIATMKLQVSGGKCVHARLDWGHSSHVLHPQPIWRTIMPPYRVSVFIPTRSLPWMAN